MARYRKIKRRGANLGVNLSARRRSFRKRGKTTMKKARRMMKRVPTTSTPIKYTVKLQLFSTSSNNVNVNNPAVPRQDVVYTIYNIKANDIQDLTTRSVIYSKFKITGIKYHFKRVVPNNNIAGINYCSISPGDYHVMFPNTFNRLLPTPTDTNANALMNWGLQQTNSKKFGLNSSRFSKSVAPLIIENTTYQGPSGITAGPDVQVTRNRKMPWLDLNSDLLDSISLGQLVVMKAPVDLLTSFPTGTGGAGSNGMTPSQAKQLCSWDVTADVTYMVKGRFLDKEIVDG